MRWKAENGEGVRGERKIREREGEGGEGWVGRWEEVEGRGGTRWKPGEERGRRHLSVVPEYGTYPVHHECFLWPLSLSHKTVLLTISRYDLCNDEEGGSVRLDCCIHTLARGPAWNSLPLHLQEGEECNSIPR